MSSLNQHGMVEKIEDLTESLGRTTNVLSTADRMIDHYRNLNTEQEYVIAKLKEDLKRSNEGNRQLNDDMEEHILHGKGKQKDDINRDPEHLINQPLRDSKRKIIHDTSSDPYNDDYETRSIPQRKKPMSPRVRFKDTKSTSDYEIELLKSTMNEFHRKQESLEAGMRKNRQIHDEEIGRLDSTLRRQLSFEHTDEKSFEINDNLRKLQQQMEEDHMEYTKQQQEVQTITQEMKSLKDVIQEATLPKKADVITTQTLEFDKKIALYKRKVNKQDDTIKLLKEQLENKKEEANACESTVYKMQTLEKMKSEQLRLLEQQFNEEKGEKINILKEFEDTQQKLTEANKERAELLYHLSDIKTEAQASKLAYEQSSYKIPQIKSLLEECEKQRDKLSDHVDNLKNELQTNNNVIMKLKSQLNDYTVNLKTLESENHDLSNQIEDATSRYQEVKRELESTKEMLSESKLKCEGLETNKHDLKERALKTLREYRNKYRKYEKQIEIHVEQQKAKEIELSKAVSVSNEQEIINLKLKKELQDITIDTVNLQQRIVESENIRNQLSFEKCQLEDALEKANDQTKINYTLQREIHELRTENQTLCSQITEEKNKRQDAQTSLKEHYEKNIISKDDYTSLKKQLEESCHKLQCEHDKHSQEMSQVKKEYKMIEEEKVSKINELSRDNEHLVRTLKTTEESLKQLTEGYDDVKKKLQQQSIESKDESEKTKNLSQKLRKITDENKKIRKQFHVMKEDYCEKLRSAQTNTSTNQNEANVLHQKDVNKVNVVETDTKDDGFAKIFTILLQDSENLLSLLSYEDENVPTVKVIPHNILPTYRKVILEIREKYQTCYSITKTLKGRFQQQKSLIKRAQDKIKSQIEQIRVLNSNRHEDSHNLEKVNTLEVLRKSDQEKINFTENLRKKDQEKIESLEKIRKNDQEKISSLENSVSKDHEKITSLEALRLSDQKIIASHKECLEKIDNLEDWKRKDIDLITRKDSEIIDLKHRINELTRDLEGCTRALHKSIEVDKERKSVLNEIELLKSEHKERQKIDENFFRCSEKIELLTEQLNEAKHSLNEIKQDSADRSETTNRLIETFGSVSPSRKRRLYLYDSPLFKTTKNVEQNDTILTSPTRDTDNVKNMQYSLNDSLEDILLKNAGTTPKS